MILRAYNQTENEHLVMMPADRFENSLEYNFQDRGRIKNTYVSISSCSVLQQRRVPQNSDYVAPPEGYTLLNLSAGMDIRTKNTTIALGIGINNLLNTRYRDYMNRFRYFSDEMGRNISIRATIPMTLFTPKSSNNN
jgi:iron complex outermembrane receptor protein